MKIEFLKEELNQNSNTFYKKYGTTVWVMLRNVIGWETEMDERKVELERAKEGVARVETLIKEKQAAIDDASKSILRLVDYKVLQEQLV